MQYFRSMLIFACVVLSGCAEHLPQHIVTPAAAQRLTLDARVATEQARVATEQARVATEQIERKYGKYAPSLPISASPPPPLITPTPSAPSRMVEEQKTAATPFPQILDRENIALVKKGGVYQLPVEINGVITLHFVLDTGAADVNIPADVALTLHRTGTIRDTDFLPGKTYTLADGSTLNSARFLLRSLKIGNRRVTNVAASIGPLSSPLLLGQSFLEQLGPWGLDSQRQVLTIGTRPLQPQTPSGTISNTSGGSRSKRTKNNAPLVNGQAVEENEGLRPHI